MGCGSAKERQDWQVDEIDESKQKRQKQPAPSSKDEVVAFRSRYAAPDPGGGGGGGDDSDDAPGDELARGPGAAARRRRRRDDDDDDDEDEAAAPVKDREMERLLASYKSKAARGPSTLLAANKHAHAQQQRPGEQAGQEDAEAAYEPAQPARGHRINMRAVLGREDSDLLESSAGGERDAERSSRLPRQGSVDSQWQRAQEGGDTVAELQQAYQYELQPYDPLADDIEALHATGFRLQHKKPPPRAAPQQPPSSTAITPHSRQPSTVDGLEQPSPAHSPHDPAAAGLGLLSMPGMILESDGDADREVDDESSSLTELGRSIGAARGERDRDGMSTTIGSSRAHGMESLQPTRNNSQRGLGPHHSHWAQGHARAMLSGDDGEFDF